MALQRVRLVLVLQRHNCIHMPLCGIVSHTSWKEETLIPHCTEHWKRPDKWHAASCSRYWRRRIRHDVILFFRTSRSSRALIRWQFVSDDLDGSEDSTICATSSLHDFKILIHVVTSQNEVYFWNIQNGKAACACYEETRDHRHGQVLRRGIDGQVYNWECNGASEGTDVGRCATGESEAD